MKGLYKFVMLGALLVALFVLGACSPGAPAAPASVASAIPEITIKALDFSYTVPTQIQSGLVTINMVNDGKEPHQAQMARLNDGVTMDQLMTTLQKGPETAALALITLAGGPNTVSAGKNQKVTLNLTAGNYVLLCFVSGDDNVPHLAKGMIAPLQVAAAPPSAAGAPPASMAEPKSDGTITLKDFAIAVPSDIKPGAHIFKVSNDGPEPHEMTLFKLTEGKTEADFNAFLQSQTPSGPPPFEPAGGIVGLNPGASGWVHLDLTPGTYIALCFIPSPATGKSHVESGMITAFAVK
ncbi:MAG: hypothetical protein HY782_08485 [Chloroflexi bacterium]|nr:hypothetical protein [Chloroflexota bacterium]